MIRPEAAARALLVQPARLRADLEDADVGRVVDVQRRASTALGGVAGPSTCARPSARPLRRSSPLIDAWRGDEALGELGLGHLEGEQRDRPRSLVVERDVLGDVRDERRLAHRRARGDDDQVAGLEAAGDLVEVAEAGRRAGERRAARRELLPACRARRARTSPTVRKSFWRSSWATSRIAALGPLDELARRRLVVVDARLDLVGRRQQPPQERVLADDLRVAGAGCRRPGRRPASASIVGLRRRPPRACPRGAGAR